ncbi:M23 family metallopeptidase [Kordiimonas aquimaris]|uniref:M23 family metallopeptidase n=1 Tax=Kordiimonas aquimaris TaxID=707591 RepID=UPI0021D26626|nr:peptidoglycan DD-metalloendopeptidase family protein [Kordiimonas aquimaris]
MRSLRVKSIEISATLRQTFAKLRMKDVIAASESPKGFAVLASIGVLLIIVGNISTSLFDAFMYSDTDAYPAALEQEPTTISNNDTASPDLTSINKPASTEPSIESLKLNRGETLIELLRRADFNRANAHRAVNALGEVTNLRRLQRGQEIRFTRNSTNAEQIAELWIRDAFDTQGHITQQESGYRAERSPIETIPLTHLVSGTITDSLYLSAKRAGLPDKVIVNLIRMMSFDIDFEREIRVGDSFQVYFERRYAPDFDDTENGRILHVELGLQKRDIDATWFEEETGEGGYYDTEGKSTRRALMKTPLDFVYVTDSYGPRKKHPVLGYRTMHTGTDFRARPGTPIMASGDGVVEMAARNGSYGNYIRIRHNNSYKTAYAHLSRYGKGIKKGRRVEQGQIIGYSGATGRVNGPHLHYEVLVNNKPVNPLTLKLPSGKSLSGDALKAFQLRREVIVADMIRIENHDQQRAGLAATTAKAR